MATFFLNTGKTLAYYSFVELSCLVRTHLAPVYLVAALLKHCTYIALFSSNYVFDENCLCPSFLQETETQCSGEKTMVIQSDRVTLKTKLFALKNG